MPKVVGVINVSPESFYRNSVCTSVEEAVKKALKMVEDGADFVDVGGMSTAPYKSTWVSEEVELRRVLPVVRALSSQDVKVSIDTTRARVAEEAISAGASILNAVRPSQSLADVAKSYGVKAIVAAREVKWDESIDSILNSCVEALKKDIALFRGCKVIADPAIGFWRKYGRWYVRDSAILANLKEIRNRIKKPVLVGVSRKSFIGEITGEKDPEDRLAGSIAAEVLSFPDYVRTHNVRETVQALKVAEFLLKFKVNSS